MRTLALSVFLLAFAGGDAHAAWAPATRLDAYFDSLQASGQVSGSVAISERGVIRYQRSIGFATIQDGVPQPADAGTRYRIGPVTRLITAVLAMQLAERGSLLLDNSVGEFFPDAPNALGTTYRNLLRERSNANYLLMGRVVEKIYDRSYDDIVRREIASRLGLARTYYAGTGTATTLESIGYAWTPEGWRADTDTDPAVDGGAGGMVSNAGDLAAIMDALFTGKLLTPYSLATMRDQTGGSGVGLWPSTIAGLHGFGERGGVGSFNAAVFYFPESRISIAWTSNAARVPMDEILGEVIRRTLKAR